ncbi:MAG: hypothetical protein ACOX8V_01570 [Thermoleophilia bacterium]
MTSTVRTDVAPPVSSPVTYVTSGKKLGYEADSWGQPPAAHYVLAVLANRCVVGTERGYYVTSSAGFRSASELVLETELGQWRAARDEAFTLLGPDF